LAFGILTTDVIFSWQVETYNSIN